MKPRMLLAKRIVLFFIGGTFLSTAFMNCGPSFEVKKLSSLGSASVSEDPTVELAFDPSMSDSIGAISSSSVPFTATSPSSEFTLKCYLNSVAIEPCKSPIDLSTSPEGDLAIRITALSKNGRLLTELSRTVRVDRTAPTVTVTSAPPSVIGTTSTAIQFSVSDNYSQTSQIVVECALDTAAFATCSSPKTFDALTPGPHTIKIHATDKAGNKSNDVASNFTVQLAAPTVMISQNPTPYTNSKIATFGFSGVSSSSTIVGYECSLDNGVTFAACTSPKSYPDLTDKAYDFAVRAKDANNQISSPAKVHFVVDTAVPSLPIVSSNLTSPSKQTSLNLSFSSSDSSGVTSYVCSKDGAAFAPCTSPQPFNALSSASHTFKVKATDQAGNVSLEGSYTIAIDLDAPIVGITGKPTNPTTDISASFVFTATDAISGVGTTECKLDTEATYTVCSSPKNYSMLPTGTRTFNLRVTDKVGNSASQNYTWMITSSTPVATPTPAPTPAPTPIPPGTGTNSPSAGCGKAVSATGVIQKIAISAAGHNRTYGLNIPTNYDPNEQLPVIFAVHAGSGTAEGFMAEIKPGSSSLEQKAIYVYPQGELFPERNATGWEESCGGYDVAYFNALIDTLSNNYCVNTKRIFAVGMSWGSDMINSLACCTGNKFRAVMPFSGTRFIPTANQCVAPAPAYRAILGSEDPIYSVPSLNGVLAKMATLSKCTGGPTTVSGAGCEGTFYNAVLCNRTSYSGCQQEVSGTVVGTLGHGMPPDYQILIWNFFGSFK